MKQGRLATNLTANLAYFVFSTLVGLWFTPYLISRLGAGGYGLIPLATTLASYMAVLTLALNSAVGRFLTVSLQQNDVASANRVFNTSVWGSVALAVVLFVPVTWFATNAGRFIQIPADQVAEAQWLFLFAAAAFLLNTILTPFEVSTFCRNRFDLRNGLAVAENLTRVGVVVTLFNLAAPRVGAVGVGMLLGTLVTFAGSVWLWRALTPELKVSTGFFDLGTLRQLAATGGWVSLNTIGSILFLGIDLLVVNRLFGAESGGRYAAALQWSSLLRGIATSIAGVFGPTIVYHHAANDVAGLVQYSRRAVKFLGLVMAIPIGLVCGFAGPLLVVWLGPSFTSLAGLMTLLTVHLCVNLAVLPLFSIQTATNRVKWPGIVTLLMGALNLGLALILAGPLRWGVYGIAAAGAIALTAKNVVFTPMYSARVLGLAPTAFLKEMLPVATATLVIAGAARVLSLFIDVNSWVRLTVAGSVLTAGYAVFAFAALLTTSEKDAVLSIGRRAGLFGGAAS